MQLQPEPPRFAHINRYFDAGNHRYAAKLLPGQFYLSRNEMIVTVVGTCAAVCIRDASRGLGGMNQFLEPHAATGAESSPGENALLELVKALLDAGAQRGYLEARVFGGANLLADYCVVAARTVESARLFLRHADIPVLEEDVGGRYPRKIDFCPL
ncbi:MAG TPA: chemoreceptor glutamine deamidase CheD, partial [Lamprocystis sp. (in: g-proteobacteria)]|nr:chemoreceptor glutamine deamidase CheD [Lamprocystis sp. (in: g-proteobacteria)]